jgi:predicted histidine transporter YuiF (NhaC family)
MIETTTFPTEVNAIAAVAGLAGALVVIVYSFTRNHQYEMRKRSARIRKANESEVDMPPQIG